MRGILFKPDMIKAIAEGRKTQTRRLDSLKEINQELDKWVCQGNPYGIWRFDHKETHQRIVVRPRYQVGEVVYIKEAWAIKDCGNRVSLTKEAWTEGFPTNRLEYVLDAPEQYWWNKRSPLFMPEWAARYFLRITAVKVQRLQEMTWADCVAEGIIDKGNDNFYSPDKPNLFYSVPQGAYAELWDSINKKPGTRWADNPFVWVYSFEKVDKVRSSE